MKWSREQLNILKPGSRKRKIIKSCKRATAASSILITILAVLAVKYMSSDFRLMAVVAELEHWSGLMENFERAEQTLKRWKADQQKMIENEWWTDVAEADLKIKGFETALRILKEPSNTQMQTGKTPRCSYCKLRQGAATHDKYCGQCGRAFDR